MKQNIDAVYENGLLRPLEPLSLADQERVSLTVESGVGSDWLDRDAVEWANENGDPTISLQEVRSRLAQVGS